jgi:hypothetical protein
LLCPTHLFGWRLYHPDSPADWYDQYYTLYLKHTEGRVIIASEPVEQGAGGKTASTKGWKLLENGTFFAINLRGEQFDLQLTEIPLEVEKAAQRAAVGAEVERSAGGQSRKYL